MRTIPLKAILPAVVMLFAFFQSKAQMTGLEVEVVTYHNQEVGLPELDGYVTYHIYAVGTNSDDFLSSMYGTVDAFDPVITPDLVDPQLFQLTSPDCDFYIDPQGAFLGGDLFQALCTPFPTSCFTTYLTIGMESTSDLGNVGSISTDPIDMGGSFETLGFMDFPDAAIYALNGLDPNGIFGPDGRVLVAQVTACGDWCFSANFLTIIEGEPGNTQEQGFSVCNPCTGFVESEPLVTDLLCATDTTGSILVNPIDPIDNTNFYLFELEEDVAQLVDSSDAGFFQNLLGGDYFVEMISPEGCRDSTEVLNVFAPDTLFVEGTLALDNVCFGETQAFFNVEITGGTDPTTFVGYDTTGDNIPEFGPADVLPGGAFTILATDDNGCWAYDSVFCSVSSQILLSSEVTPVSCFGSCDGAIDLSVVGGAGAYEYAWVLCDETQAQTQDLDSLCGCGNYTLTVTDSLGCEVEGLFLLDQPEEIQLDLTSTPITCADSNDGTLVITSSGGTGDLEINEDGLPGDFDAVEEGVYIIELSDENGCMVSDTVEYINPAPINFSLNIHNVDCGGESTGQIQVTATGGEGDLFLSIDPDLGTVEDEGFWQELPAGAYNITIQDNTCTLLLDTLITEPEPLALDTLKITNLTCFGNATGSIELVSNNQELGPVSYQLNDLVQIDNGLFENLDAAVYALILTDGNGCVLEQEITVDEPEDFVLDIVASVGIDCASLTCTGEASTEATGGTLPVISEIWNNDLLQSPDKLCEGWNIVEAIDSNGCIAQDSIFIESPEPFGFVFDIDNVTCTGMSDGGAEVLVTNANGSVIISASPTSEIVELEQNIFQLDFLSEDAYIIQAIDSLGCQGQDTLVVGADILSDLELTLFQTAVTCWEQRDGTATVAIVGAQGEASIVWSDPAAQTTATAIGLEEAVYTVTVEDALGCKRTDQIEVDINEDCLFISTAITPNADGDNDVWVLGGLEFYPDCKVSVYNRWGQELFESKGYLTPWDGTLDGQKLPVSDYYYVISLNPQSEALVGTVTLKY